MGTDTRTSAPEARPRKAGIVGLAPLDRPEGAAVERAVQWRCARLQGFRKDEWVLRSSAI
jgi:hypothetical protein